MFLVFRESEVKATEKYNLLVIDAEFLEIHYQCLNHSYEVLAEGKLIIVRRYLIF